MWVHGSMAVATSGENGLSIPSDQRAGTTRWTLQPGAHADLFVSIPTLGVVPAGFGSSTAVSSPALVSDIYILYNAMGGSILGMQLFDGASRIGDVFGFDGGFTDTPPMDLNLGFEGPFTGDHSAQVETSPFTSRNRFHLGGEHLPVSVALGIRMRFVANESSTFDLVAAGARFDHETS